MTDEDVAKLVERLRRWATHLEIVLGHKSGPELCREAAAALTALSDAMSYLRDGWSPISSRGCPACVYVEGRFIRSCKLHDRISQLESELASLREDRERYEKALKEISGIESSKSAVWPCTKVAREALRAHDHSSDHVRESFLMTTPSLDEAAERVALAVAQELNHSLSNVTEVARRAAREELERAVAEERAACIKDINECEGDLDFALFKIRARGSR